MNESLDNIPLRDLCKEAERLTRELIDHIERNLLPRTRELHDLVRPESPLAPTGRRVEDITVRSSASTLFESQEFTAQLYSKVTRYFAAIDRSIAEISNG